MTKTKISDIVVVADTMYPYMVQRSTENSRLYQSGIVANDPQLDAAAEGAAMTVRMPFWNDLSGQSEGLSDTTALTPDKIGADQDKAVKHYRGKSWAANDLVKYFAGADPIRAIVDRIADYWTRDMQSTILVPTLNGLFGTAGALTATHQLNIATTAAGAPTDANRIGSEAIINGTGLLGDRWADIVGMAMHSVTFRRLQILQLIEFVSLGDQNLQVPFFLGREIIVDDGIASIDPGGGLAIRYPIYMFGRGAIALGNATPNDGEAFETDRDSLAGDDILITRRHFILHPRGVAFVGTYTGQTPAPSDLSTPANWDKVYSDTNVRIIRLLVNA
jgi:hypothetical protein